MHQPTPATPGGRTGSLSTYRLELAEQRALSIRLHCQPASPGESPRIVAVHCLPQQASRFNSFEAAAAVHARYLPHTPVEIVRVDA